MTLLEVLVVLVIVTMMVGFTIHGGEQIRSQMSAQFSLNAVYYTISMLR
nr:hypothetical protein [Brochothrix thermosphacta]